MGRFLVGSGKRGRSIRAAQRAAPNLDTRAPPDVAKEEARDLGELAERRDLLLVKRRGSANEPVVPVVALLAQVDGEPVGVLVRRERAQVEPVEVLELLVVEDGRARAHALERE